MKKNWLAINVLVSLQSAKKKWIVLKIFCRNLAGFFYPFLFTKITNEDNKFGINKKASTFALPIKKGSNKKAKRSLKVWKQQHVLFFETGHIR
jgi:hypothetical protein